MITHSPPPQSTAKAMEIRTESQATISSILAAKALNNLHRFSLTRIGKVTFTTGLTISAIWAVNWTPSFLSASHFLMTFDNFFIPKTLGVIFSVLIFYNKNRIKNIILRRVDKFTPKIDGISRKRILEHLWKNQTFSRKDFTKNIGGHKDKYDNFLKVFSENEIVFKNKNKNNAWSLSPTLSKENLKKFLESSDSSGDLFLPPEIFVGETLLEDYIGKDVGFSARRI